MPENRHVQDPRLIALPMTRIRALSETPAEPTPGTIDMLLAADEGDGSGAWLMSPLAQVAFPSEQLWGDVAAVAMSDVAHARRSFASDRDRTSLIGTPGADLIWAGGELVDAWPANPDENEYTQVRDSKVETLLIGGNLDFATPPQWATRDLLSHLANWHENVLEDLGHTDDFWTYEPEASKRLVNTFFDTGRVDTSLYTHNSVDFTPSLSPGAIAQILLGVMLGLAALAVLSLAWMALRVRWRGGLGGWILGVFIVLTTMPGVPLDDDLLAVLSVVWACRSAWASTSPG